jgi:hypothetical protein
MSEQITTILQGLVNNEFSLRDEYGDCLLCMGHTRQWKIPEGTWHVLVEHTSDCPIDIALRLLVAQDVSKSPQQV